MVVGMTVDPPSPEPVATGSDSPACSTCGGPTVRIVYGFPGTDLFDAADRGEVALGGCLSYRGQPTHRCLSCQPDEPFTEIGLPRTIAEALAAGHADDQDAR